jgi:glycosyltransferase involved in cell wall biosynthesis
MHVMIFSYDRTLVEGEQTGDTLLRHQGYAEYLDRLDVIVPAPSKTRRYEIKVNEKMSIFPSYGPRAISWLRAYAKAKKICRQSKVDIVATQDAVLGFLGVMLRRKFGCRLQINTFGLEIFSDWWLGQRWLNRWYAWIMRWTLRRADLVRADATRNRAILIEKLGLKPEKVVVIPALPTQESIDQFRGADGGAVRSSLKENKYDRIVLFVGALDKVKNIPSLLRAAKWLLADCPRTLFVIIGSGSEKGSLERLSRELGISQNVSFPGIIPYDELPAYYAACDVVVLPSWSEGLARTLMEASLAAKPIVATDVGGAPDIVVDGATGYLVPVNNDEQLAARVKELLQDDRKAQQMGAKGYQRAADLFDFKANTERLIATWEAMIEPNEDGGNALADN